MEPLVLITKFKDPGSWRPFTIYTPHLAWWIQLEKFWKRCLGNASRSHHNCFKKSSSTALGRIFEHRSNLGSTWKSSESGTSQPVTMQHSPPFNFWRPQCIALRELGRYAEGTSVYTYRHIIVTSFNSWLIPEETCSVVWYAGDPCLGRSYVCNHPGIDLRTSSLELRDLLRTDMPMKICWRRCCANWHEDHRYGTTQLRNGYKNSCWWHVL